MAGRPRAFDRNEALHKALLAFWMHGYDATSIAMLTECMGIGAPSLYAAFGDKRALFDEALAAYGKSYGAFMVQVFREESDALAAITRLLNEAAVMFTDKAHPPGCLVIAAATNCTPDSAPVQQRLLSFRKMTVRALEETIARAKAGGRLSAHVDVRGLALFYSATLQGMSAQARDGATRRELQAVVEMALKAWPG